LVVLRDCHSYPQGRTGIAGAGAHGRTAICTCGRIWIKLRHDNLSPYSEALRARALKSAARGEEVEFDAAAAGGGSAYLR
jgi:hypothetical protein